MGVAVPLETLRELSKIDEPEDFKAEIYRRLGNRPLATPIEDRVLCAVYIENQVIARPRGPDGKVIELLKPDEQVKESIWQGKVMLVLAVGEAAFKDNSEYAWRGRVPKPGDWVLSKVSATTQTEFRRIPSRIVHDYLIEAILDDPRDITS